MNFKYQKKPVQIEAFQYNYGEETETPQWFEVAKITGTVFFDDDILKINTLEGVHNVSNGDYIIRGIAGELYPCKPDIFKDSYDKIK